MSRPYPHASKHTSEPECVAVHGLSEGKEFPDDFRQAREPEIQVREQAFLVPRVLYQHSRGGCSCISAYIRNQLSEDHAMEQLTFKEYLDPFTGGRNEKA